MNNNSNNNNNRDVYDIECVFHLLKCAAAASAGS